MTVQHDQHWCLDTACPRPPPPGGQPPRPPRLAGPPGCPPGTPRRPPAPGEASGPPRRPFSPGTRRPERPRGAPASEQHSLGLLSLITLVP